MTPDIHIDLEFAIPWGIWAVITFGIAVAMVQACLVGRGEQW
jgi:hypothetical protein